MSKGTCFHAVVAVDTSWGQSGSTTLLTSNIPIDAGLIYFVPILSVSLMQSLSNGDQVASLLMPGFGSVIERVFY